MMIGIAYVLVEAAPNKSLEPTGISENVIENLAVSALCSRRVMPGVRPRLK